MGFPEGEGQRYLADYRCDDRLPGQCDYWRTEIPVARGRCQGLRSMGSGVVLACLRRRDGALRGADVHPVAVGLPAGKAHEPVAAGRSLCRQSRIEHPPCPHVGHY